MNTQQTMAEKFSSLMGDDGMRFTSLDGRTFEEMLSETIMNFSMREYLDDGNDSAPFRYEFEDGSAIVKAGDAWDIEGETHYSWAGYSKKADDAKNPGDNADAEPFTWAGS